MPDCTLKLHIGCVPQFRFVNEKDTWQSVAGIFARYDVVQLRMDLYKIFKVTVSFLQRHATEEEILDLTFIFEHLNDFIDHMYISAIEQGAITESSIFTPEPAPRSLKKRVTDQDMVFQLCIMYHPDEIKEAIWDMLLGGIVHGTVHGSKTLRIKTLTLFEDLINLVSIAYAMYARGCTPERVKS